MGGHPQYQGHQEHQPSKESAGISIPGKPGIPGTGTGATQERTEEHFTTAGVPENMRIYSSVHHGEKPGTGHARSTLNSPQAWSAGRLAVGEYMQMDLGQVKTVGGIAIQPRKGNSQYVKTYTVSTSLDGKTFAVAPGVYNGHAQNLQMNVFSDGHRPRARYVRVYPQTWNSFMSMRADVLLLDDTTTTTTSTGGYGLGPLVTIENKTTPGQFLSTAGAEEPGISLSLSANPADLVSQFYLVDIGNGQYNLMNAHSMKCVNVSRHKQIDGANVIQDDNPRSPETRFKIQKVGGGNLSYGHPVTIESCYTSGKYLSAKNACPVMLIGNASQCHLVIRLAGGSAASSRL